MRVYKVGGAIRDRLLGLKQKDIDYVVTGSTPEQMVELGYRPIGKDFPVFLDPKNNQEYALARTERKVSRGYAGFDFNTDPAITIEQDLERRDLTINAIAEDDNGNLIDPFNGQRDIDQRLLRHVSNAFVEDPVRVLRVARFAARFAHLGFHIADETCELIKQVGESGELDALVAERVWNELHRALGEQDPQVFFESLKQCEVLHRLFPDIDRLFGVPQTEKYHPEIDTGIHLMMTLKQAALLGFDSDVRFAVLMHDLGKGTTAKDILPSHHGHEKRSAKLAKLFCKQWRVPNTYSELAIITAEFHTHIHRIFELTPKTLLKLFAQTDIYRRPERFDKMTQACEADARGRKGLEQQAYPQAAHARHLARSLRELDLSTVLNQGLEGKALGQAIQDYRLQHLKQLIKERQD